MNGVAPFSRVKDYGLIDRGAGRSISQEVLGNLEQEPKPADGRGNERNRKYSVLQTAKHQKRYRSSAKPQRNPRLNLTGQGY
jgi:hypothetical protein